MGCQVHRIRPVPVRTLLGSVPHQIILTVGLAPDGDHDLFVLSCVLYGDLHFAVIRGDDRLNRRSLCIRQLRHIGRGTGDQFQLSGLYAVDMDLITARGIVGSKVHGVRPAAVRLLGRFIPADVILTVGLAPDGDHDLFVCSRVLHGDLHRAELLRDDRFHRGQLRGRQLRYAGCCIGDQLRLPSLRAVHMDQITTHGIVGC